MSNESNIVLACSALTKKYRIILRIDQKEIFSVYLKGSFSLLKARIASRSHEFMATDLLESQLDTLEEPETGFVADISESPDEIDKKIIDKIITC